MLCFESNNTFLTSKREKIYYFCKWLTSGNNLGDQRNVISNEISVVSPRLAVSTAAFPRLLWLSLFQTLSTKKFRFSSWINNFFPMFNVIVAIVATDKTSLLDMILALANDFFQLY